MTCSRTRASEAVSDPAVHARVTVVPTRDCPVAQLGEQYGLRELIPPSTPTDAPQAVVETTDEDALRSLGVCPVVPVGDATVCRLDALERDGERVHACGHDHCLAHGFDFLPLDPYHSHWTGDKVRCSFAAVDADAVCETTTVLADAGFDVSLDQLVRDDHGGDGEIPEIAQIALGGLTERQREVATVAVERGYFNPDGPTAETVAADIGVSKSTLSEHLRVVQRALVQQTFVTEP